MNRLVIVSPHFPPVNAADHQRVRMSLPFLLKDGWDVDVLAVDDRDVSAPKESFLSASIPATSRIHRCRVPARLWTRLPGMGSLGYRCLPAMRRELKKLLSAPCHADGQTVVYFSTTQFPVHLLIPEIKSWGRFTVCMDFQDPWATDYYRQHPEMTPPGGRIKFAVSNYLAFRHERKIWPHLDGFTAVSSAYPKQLQRRYTESAEKPSLVLPFGATTSDFDALANSDVRQTCFDPNDGFRHWVYVGRGGADMHRATRSLCIAFREAMNTDPALQKVRLHFIGTDYAAKHRARASLIEVAEDEGVAANVREYPARIPFSEALRCLLDADALVVPGSDDPAYTASKIYPYILARKPMLTIFHASSSIVDLMERTRAASCVTFESHQPENEIAAKLHRRWFSNSQYVRQPDTDWEKFAPYTAEHMTRQLSKFLIERRDATSRHSPAPAATR